nr:oxidative stress defense protein [Vibrio mexicanus]
MKVFSPLVLTVMSLSVPATVMAQSPEFPHIATTGYGEVVATPDMAVFKVKVVETTLTAEQAKQTVDRTIDGFLASLKAAGVSNDSIKSSNLSIAPQYHYPKKGQPELVGYRASRSVTVTVQELAKLNSYLDIALKQGINQVDSIELKVKDQAKYQDRARLAAIKDANYKASALAEGFERQLGDVWKINYNMQHSQPVMMRAMAMDAATESNSYQDSTLIIRDRVDVIYQLD